MCRRNICSIPLEFPVPRRSPPHPGIRALTRSGSRSDTRRPLSLSLSLSLSSLLSSFPSNFFHRPRPLLIPPPPPPSLRTSLRYWTLRLFARGRQVYFYSVRFIRLNMTCGYSPGDIFPILRDDIPTLARVPRVSCIPPARIAPPLAPSAALRRRPRGKIRTILAPLE